MTNEKDTNRVEIFGVGVQLNSPDIMAAKDLDDLKKLEIFSHLSEAEQQEAYSKLLESKG